MLRAGVGLTKKSLCCNLFQPPVAWVVPVADKMRFDEIFLKTDLDLDGYVSGQEVKEIFMHSGLTQNLLAHIW